MALRLLIPALFLLVTSSATAYTQNRALEAALARSDPDALSLLPAKGYKDGAAGFFRRNGLSVIPNSVRAWCTEAAIGVLPPGCYVEFYFQIKGLRTNASDGSPCGLLGRWHRSPAGGPYGATLGAHFSRAIAGGDREFVMSALEDEQIPVQLADVRRAAECGSKAMQ